MPTPEERAAKLIAANRFLSLATSDAEGAWIAPVNYVIGPGDHLHFYSTKEARHSLAVARDHHVAVAIFNSQAATADVDGVQIAARCDTLDGDELRLAHEHYFAVNWPDEAERAWWYRPAEQFTEAGRWWFFRLSLLAAWVIDYESIKQDRVDRRLPADVRAIWRNLQQRPRPSRG